MYRAQMIALVVCALAAVGPARAAVAGTRTVPLQTRSAILDAVQRNRGLCCKVAPISVTHVVLSDDRRFASASTSGGNGPDPITVILWRGTSRWAVVEYGSDIAGCGFIPTTAIGELFSEPEARACPRQIRSDPFFHGSDETKIRRAAQAGPWLADHDRGERVVDLRSLRTISRPGAFATVAVRVETRGAPVTRFGLLRRGTAMWSLVDVNARADRLGCGLLEGAVRRALRLPGSCGA
jgi:hypothetical protein